MHLHHAADIDIQGHYCRGPAVILFATAYAGVERQNACVRHRCASRTGLQVCDAQDSLALVKSIARVICMGAMVTMRGAQPEGVHLAVFPRVSNNELPTVLCLSKSW